MTLKGFLRRLFLQQQRPAIEDPTFGHIEYNHADRAWYGQWTHPHVEGRLEVEIYADESGPTSYQRDVFRNLTSNLDSVEAQIDDALVDDYHRSTDETMTSKDIWEHSVPTGMTIYDRIVECDSYNFNIAIHYSVDWDDEHGRNCLFVDQDLMFVSRE